MGKERKTGGLLGTIERVGNMLPHPFILFLYIIAALAVLSTVLSLLGVSAVNPTTGELVEVQNIISRDGLVWIVENMLTNFSTFAPLGLVLAMQMAIGLAEGAGLLDTFMRRAILGVPLWALSATVLFLGINGSIASEASIIVIPALAATAFQAMGKHPIAGLIAGYAATNAGFTANVLITRHRCAPLWRDGRGGPSDRHFCQAYACDQLVFYDRFHIPAYCSGCICQ